MRERFLTSHGSLAYDYPEAYWKKFGGTFDPIPGLRSNKSDLVIVIVITRGTRWRTPVNDPLYSAHRVLTKRMTDNSTNTFYTPDAPASAFACQYQVLSPTRIVL